MLRDRVAIVTGAKSGLGLETTKALLQVRLQSVVLTAVSSGLSSGPQCLGRHTCHAAAPGRITTGLGTELTAWMHLSLTHVNLKQQLCQEGIAATVLFVCACSKGQL